MDTQVIEHCIQGYSNIGLHNQGRLQLRWQWSLYCRQTKPNTDETQWRSNTLHQLVPGQAS